MTYSIHRSPVWRERADFIINAELDADGRFEQLWTRRIDESSFEICCIPFFLYDVALGDIVTTTSDESHRYLFDRVLTSSERYVFRVYFPAEQLLERAGIEARLVESGALTEWSSESLLAVDVVDRVHAEAVAAWLADLATEGVIVYEAGRLTVGGFRE